MTVTLTKLRKKELIDRLISMGIKDRKVLDAIFTVKREEFVSEEMRKYAYENNALPIDCSQTISQPYTVAFMTELLKVKKGMKILEIGTGSGYQAAILKELGADVYSVERIKELYEQSANVLSSLGYDVKLKCGDGSAGWAEHAPYDGIVVTAASPKLPEKLVGQLSPDGRLVIPVGNRFVQKIWCVHKKVDRNNKVTLETEQYSDFKFVPLLGEGGW